MLAGACHGIPLHMPVFVMFVGMCVCALVSVSVAWVCEDGVRAACVVFVCGVWEKGESVLFRVCMGAVLGAQGVFGTWCVCVCPCLSPRVCGGGG